MLSHVDDGAEARKTCLRVAKAGYGDIDEGRSEDGKGGSGRMSFGRFNREVEVRTLRVKHVSRCITKTTTSTIYYAKATTKLLIRSHILDTAQ